MFYLNFFIQAGVLSKRIREVDVITGLIGFIMFSTMSTTALSFIRHWNYRIFYTTHILLAIILVDVLIFHVSHIRNYVFEMLAIFVLLQIIRQAKTRQLPGSIALIPGTNLVQVTVPLSSDKDVKKFKPGQHVHLSRPPLGPPTLNWANAFAQRYRTNPFTIASIPAKDKQLLLVARTLAGNTTHLAAIAQSQRTTTDGTPPSIPLTIEGPYGARLPDFRTFDTVLLVAGGVGATFAVPLFRSLTEGGGGGGGGPDDAAAPVVLRTRVQLVWAVRRLAETRWAFPAHSPSKQQDDAPPPPPPSRSPPPSPGSDNHGVDIFVTRGGGGGDGAEEVDRGLLADEDEDIELAEMSAVARGEEEGEEEGEEGKEEGEEGEGYEEKLHRRTVSRGRPDLAAVVDDAFSVSTGAVAVLVCGPSGMVRELRRHVGVWVGRGRDVFWHAEAFGF